MIRTNDGYLQSCGNYLLLNCCEACGNLIFTRGNAANTGTLLNFGNEFVYQASGHTSYYYYDNTSSNKIIRNTNWTTSQTFKKFTVAVANGGGTGYLYYPRYFLIGYSGTYQFLPQTVTGTLNTETYLYTGFIDTRMIAGRSPQYTDYWNGATSEFITRNPFALSKTFAGTVISDGYRYTDVTGTYVPSNELDLKFALREYSYGDESFYWGTDPTQSYSMQRYDNSRNNPFGDLYNPNQDGIIRYTGYHPPPISTLASKVETERQLISDGITGYRSCRSESKWYNIAGNPASTGYSLEYGWHSFKVTVTVTGSC